jgi:endogenous inhibitor of DNA gyrase (YacG/DUF329 family)
MTRGAETSGQCAICGKPRETATYRPFCSKRCADLDLRRWLTGGYVVPGEAVEDGEGGRFDPDPDA